MLALLLEHSGMWLRARSSVRSVAADTFVDFDTGLNSAIKKLRDVLGDSAEEPRYIETLPPRYRSLRQSKTATCPPRPLAKYMLRKLFR